MKSLDGIKPFEKKVWLSSPTMHGEELAFMKEAFESNWMSTVGKNINEVERQVAERIGCRYAERQRFILQQSLPERSFTDRQDHMKER